MAAEWHDLRKLSLLKIHDLVVFFKYCICQSLADIARFDTSLSD